MTKEGNHTLAVKNQSNASIEVYICYERNDGRWYTTALGALLAELGYTILTDPALSRNTDYWHSLPQTLRRASAMILVGTPRAFYSEFVNFELETFRRCQPNGMILSIVFDAIAVRNEQGLFWLRDKQWIIEEFSQIKRGPTENALVDILEFLMQAKPYSTRIAPSPFALPPTQTRSLGEGKLILVGRGEVGKTSLINRLVHKQFHEDEGKTQGINITRWNLTSGPSGARLNIWDFGGQEIMHATHQFFLTERSVYLLVLNGREGGEDEDAEYWLKHIVTFGGDSPVIIVQNKISQHPFELNYRGLLTRYPQIRAFVKTDCRDESGLEKLYSEIKRVVNEMPLIRMQVPLTWFKVKTKMEALKTDFISYERYRILCLSQGIYEESDQSALSWLLHCLGVALNYKDDWRLRETSVLKPEWVTRGIYSILNAKTISERQGELNLKELTSLLPIKGYPVERHAFLLELMRKFSLCFAFPDDSDRYLIPELLGKEEPEEAQVFTANDCLNFEYMYEVLPEGVLPRFIVRSHILSRGQSRWRTGAILVYEDCRALVKAEIGERRVIIRVKGGGAESRRRLLAIIRYDFDRINGEFKDRLEVQSRVPMQDHPETAIDYNKLVKFERAGIKNFPEVIGDDVIAVDVSKLLSGVDLPLQRDSSLEVIMNARAIFFCYAHEDENLRDELEVHLKLLQRQGVVSTWHDRKIVPGKDWKSEIDNYIEAADIILLLVSADFIASDYCWEKEFKRALQRHSAGEAVVIPVLLRPCDWERAPFGKLQGLPKDLKPITEWLNRDTAWTDVAKGIRLVAEAQAKGRVAGGAPLTSH